MYNSNAAVFEPVPWSHQRHTFVWGFFVQFWVLSQQIVDTAASDVCRAVYFIQMIKPDTSWPCSSQWSQRVSHVSSGGYCLSNKDIIGPPTWNAAWDQCYERNTVDSLSDHFAFQQKLFVIITFSKHIVEQMVLLIGWVFTSPWGGHHCKQW